MSDEKQGDIWEVLNFLGPRLRELLRRCARVDRRDPIQEFAFILEKYATGRLRDIGDEPSTPRVSLDDLPQIVLVEKTLARRVTPSGVELDSPPLPEEAPAKSAPRESPPRPRGGGV